MADIDKPVYERAGARTTEIIPGQQEMQQQQMNSLQNTQQPVEVTPTEDGGAEVNFDPGAMAPQGGERHDENLAEYLDNNSLLKIGDEIGKSYEDFKSSRKDWEETYTKGLDLLGFKYENRVEPFQGASGATHPVLAEAVTQFQALAYKELLPASGPVRTQVIGKRTSQREQQSQRVKEYMNWQLMVNMKEYEPEFDQMLFNLPLSGSTFKKVYYDALLQRCVSKFVPAEDLYVPYTATSLEDAESVIHSIKMTSNDVRKYQLSGFYLDIDLQDPIGRPDEVKEKKDDIIGIGASENTDDVYTLLESHCEMDLDGFEDMNPQTGEPTGLKVPYIITIEESSSKVLSIRRNFQAQDPSRKKKDYFVHFKFLPGLGFYGFGLIHMIGGLSRTATAALRQLLDAGTLSNLPAGFKMRGIRVRDEAQPLQPGEFRDVDAPGGNLRDAFMPLPFKEPSQTLLALMGAVVQAGQRFASIADMQVGDGNQSAAVGTTVALLERGSRVMSAIHKRLYAAMKREFMLLAKCFVTYLPPQYPYDVVGGQRQIFKADFDDKVDIVPVADPNIFSQTQRITMAQTQLQLAMSNPQMHNLYQAYKDMYEALGVKEVDLILKPEEKPQAMDPATENLMALGSKKIQAFEGQDHKAHMDTHLSFMGTVSVRTNPPVLASLQKNCLEHIALMAQEQVKMEFKKEYEEITQIQQQMAPMMQQMQQNPQMAQQTQQNPQFIKTQKKLKSMTEAIEARKAQLAAEIMADYLEEEKKVLNQMDSDPLLKLKADEVQIKAKKEQRETEEGQSKAELDQLRMVQGQNQFEEKLEQDDEHQKLRVAASLAKDGIKRMDAKKP